MTLTDEKKESRTGLTRCWAEPKATFRGESLFEAMLGVKGWAGERQRKWFGPKPDFDGFAKPYRHPDFLAAAEVIRSALDRGRKIAIYGDYDADGITATAILFHAIRALEPDVTPRCYIPHRRKEGYGLHLEALRTLRAEGIDLVVTVDCGIVAVDEVAAARAEGLSIVVTDHHEPRPDGRIPEADAVVHPRLKDREHACPECCAAMIAWKLAWTLFHMRAGSPDRGILPKALGLKLMQLSALAAIGTVADVMPLLGDEGKCLENREVVRWGLSIARQAGIPGLEALWAFGDIAKDGVTSEAIAYRLAPRLNVAGRLESAEKALRLLTVETDPARCREIVRDLDLLNQQRREREREIFDEVLERIEGQSGAKPPPAIVEGHPTWDAGLVGIVCSRLLERYGCPVLLFQTDLDSTTLAKGSGRAPPDFPLHEAIHSAITSSGVTPRSWGGHAAAAGMTLETSFLPAFRRSFMEESRRRGGTGGLSTLEVDLEIPRDTDPRCLSLAAIRELERIGPFGKGNRRPSILLRGVRISSSPRIFGKEAKGESGGKGKAPVGPGKRDPGGSGGGKHLEMNLCLGTTGRSDSYFRSHWWNAAPLAERIRIGRDDCGDPILHDVVVIPRISRFLREERVELEILDLAPAGSIDRDLEARTQLRNGVDRVPSATSA